ncbi:PA2169 family four-helix-bundle protein [Brevundimonas sp. NPDC090276]|uniref:PA2169 family four-helix-bundle protein n=1 Tax=Brevundimonas sp. NPDC090276 TaxID=3363956 RepID=UPI003839ED08
MNSPNSHDIKVLNDLAGGLIDSADGYAEAAAQTDDDRHRALFAERSNERRQTAAELQAAVHGMGGEISEDRSILAKAQRAFTDIKHALIREEQAVVSAVDNDEQHLQARFEHALADETLSATTRETIRRAYAAVKTGHEQMHLLRRSLEGQHDADDPLRPR